MLKSCQYWKLWLTVPTILYWMQSAQAAEKLQSHISTIDSAEVNQHSAFEKVKSDAKDATLNFDRVNNSDLNSTEAKPTTEMMQVTPVWQLTDVKPTDWVFQALQSLVKRYGCIAGYPDRAYRGNHALTRYEFAVGLNACLERVNELNPYATANVVKKEDLTILKKLQEQFAAELAILRGRVHSVEAHTTPLEKQQFSTTTKLFGYAWLNITGAGASGDVQFEGPRGSEGNAEGRFFATRTGGQPTRGIARDPQITASYHAWLTFLTSFTGKDQLVTQLASGNGRSPYNQYASAGFYNSAGVPFFDQTAGSEIGQNDVVIKDFFYSFSLNDAIKLTVGPRINWNRHFDINRLSSILNSGASLDSSNSTQSNSIIRGSGAVIEWGINSKLRLAVGYLGENTEFLSPQFGFNSSSNPSQGLFGGTNTTSAELTFSPSFNFNLRLQYNYTRIQAINGQVGGSIGEPIPYGYLDAGAGFSEGGIRGGLESATGSMFGINFDWLITRGIGLFGRYSFASMQLNPIDAKVDTQAFQVGVAFPDLGKEGAQGTVTFLMPMDIIRGSRFFASGAGDGGIQYELEASYFYPLSENIAIVPTFYAVFNPNNFESNPTVFVGSIRTQFSF
ncbi:MAG: iron uptake porin [Nostoc sp.]|uniref:iron uptake porin n=1 Tax=Nostoc sp. TaxID=1180 RepID=UPI002FF5E82B